MTGDMLSEAEPEGKKVFRRQSRGAGLGTGLGTGGSLQVPQEKAEGVDTGHRGRQLRGVSRQGGIRASSRAGEAQGVESLTSLDVPMCHVASLEVLGWGPLCTKWGSGLQQG